MKRFLRIWGVKKKTGKSESAIRRGVVEGIFPGPIKSGGVSVWLEDEVDAWMDAQVKAHRGGKEAATDRGPECQIGARSDDHHPGMV